MESKKINQTKEKNTTLSVHNEEVSSSREILPPCLRLIILGL